MYFSSCNMNKWNWKQVLRWHHPNHIYEMAKESPPASLSQTQSGGIQVELREKRASGCGDMSHERSQWSHKEGYLTIEASEMERTKVEMTRKLCAFVVSITNIYPPFIGF